MDFLEECFKNQMSLITDLMVCVTMAERQLCYCGSGEGKEKEKAIAKETPSVLSSPLIGEQSSKPEDTSDDSYQTPPLASSSSVLPLAEFSKENFPVV